METTDASSSSSSSSSTIPYPLHVAIWTHDLDAFRSILADAERTQTLATVVNEHGPIANGEQPIYLALRLGHVDMIQLLLDTKVVDFSERTREGWRALILSLPFLRSYPPLTLRLVSLSAYQAEKLLFDRLHLLQETLATLPDFTMKLKFYFTTWVPIIGRLFPSDECIIRKIHGSGLRIDFTLAGFNPRSFNWRRGNLSFLLTLPSRPGPLSYTALNAAYGTTVVPDPAKIRYDDYVRYTHPDTLPGSTALHPFTGRIYVLDHVMKRWAELSLPEIIERKLRRKDHFGLLRTVTGDGTTGTTTTTVPNVSPLPTVAATESVASSDTPIPSSTTGTAISDTLLHASTLDDELDLEHSALHLVSAGWPHVQSWSQRYPTIQQEMKEKGFFRRMFNFGRHSYVKADRNASSSFSSPSSSPSPIPPRGTGASPIESSSLPVSPPPPEETTIYEYSTPSNPREEEIRIHEQAIRIGSPRSSTTGKLTNPHQEPVTERIGNFVGCVFKMSDIVVAVEARPPMAKGSVEMWETNHRQQLFGTGTTSTATTSSPTVPRHYGTVPNGSPVSPPMLPSSSPVSPGTTELSSTMASSTLTMPGTLLSKLRPSKQAKGSLAGTLITHMFHTTPPTVTGIEESVPTFATTAEGTTLEPTATMLLNTTSTVLHDSFTTPIETYADHVIVIGSRQIEKYTVPVNPNDSIEWTIQLILQKTKHELDFSIEFVPTATTTMNNDSGTNTMMILPVQRIAQSQGTWKSSMQGTVTFLLDNRTSFWYRKKVQVHILKHHETSTGSTDGTGVATESANVIPSSSTSLPLPASPTVLPPVTLPVFPPLSTDTHVENDNDIDQERKDLIHMLARISNTSISSSSAMLSNTTKTKYRNHPLRSIIFPTCNIVNVPFSTYFGADSIDVQRTYRLSPELLPANDEKVMIAPPVPQFLTRTLEAKIVGTPSFPLTVQQFLPILEAMASTQGHINDIRYFLTSIWPANAGFPVAFDMPIMGALGVHFRWEIVSMELHESPSPNVTNRSASTTTTTTTTTTAATISGGTKSPKPVNPHPSSDPSLLDIPEDYTDATLLLIQELFFEKAGVV